MLIIETLFENKCKKKKKKSTTAVDPRHMLLFNESNQKLLHYF